MEPLLTVQIPTYRNLKQLHDTLTSLLLHTEYPLTVKVLNNDPPSSPYLNEMVDGIGAQNVEVLETGGNKGWMGAHNLALKDCTTPYVCLLNDDVVFLPFHNKFWRELCDYFRHPEVGAVGPSSNFVMGSQNLWNIAHPLVYETTLLIGFCVVMRTRAIQEIGGLDETLPGGDDMDWSIRLRQAGYRLLVNRRAFLFHIGQQTGRRVHGAAWDGVVHQENTVNALVRKHGVRRWYDCYSAKVMPCDPAGLGEKNDEDLWMERAAQACEGKRGLNLGAGHRKDVPGFALDIARKGEQGAGGRKFWGAEVDVTADATQVPVQPSCLDFLLAAHLLEHLVDPVAVLKEWREAMKEDGVLYLVVPHHGRLDTMVIDYTHVHAYQPPSLMNLLSVCGWEVEACQRFDTGAFGVIANPGKSTAYVLDRYDAAVDELVRDA